MPAVRVGWDAGGDPWAFGHPGWKRFGEQEFSGAQHLDMWEEMLPKEPVLVAFYVEVFAEPSFLA